MQKPINSNNPTQIQITTYKTHYFDLSNAVVFKFSQKIAHAAMDNEHHVRDHRLEMKSSSTHARHETK